MDYDIIEFDEELYQQNLAENDFSSAETDGKGEDQNDRNN